MKGAIERFSGKFPMFPVGFLSQLDRSLERLFNRDQPYAVTSVYNFSDADSVDSVQVDATTTAVTVYLPSSPTGNRRRRVIKSDSSTNVVTVNGNGNLINGSATVALTYQYEYVWVEATGSSWVIIARGTLTPSFNSIAFPATQVASADPNTLDDYEEGTWTPSVGGSATYTRQSGRYTKIGRLVSIEADIIINSIGTGSTGTITGLPFSCGFSNTAIVVPYWNTAASSFYSLGGYIGGTSIRLVGIIAAAASVTDTATVFQNGTQILLSGSYSV